MDFQEAMARQHASSNQAAHARMNEEAALAQALRDGHAEFDKHMADMFDHLAQQGVMPRAAVLERFKPPKLFAREEITSAPPGYVVGYRASRRESKFKRDYAEEVRFDALVILPAGRFWKQSRADFSHGPDEWHPFEPGLIGSSTYSSTAGNYTFQASGEGGVPSVKTFKGTSNDDPEVPMAQAFASWAQQVIECHATVLEPNVFPPLR